MAAARLLFAAFPRSEPIRPPRGPVVFVRWDGKYGDYVVSAFLYAAVARIAGSRIVVVVAPGQEDLYRRTAGVDAVIACRRKSPADVLATTLALRRLRPDMIVELNDRARWSDLILMAFGGAKVRIKGRRPKTAVFEIAELPEDDHVTTRYRAFLAAIGGTAEDWRFDWRLPEPARARAADAFGDHPGRRILLNPVGAGRGRRLSAARVRAIAEALTRETPARIVVPLPPGHADDFAGIGDVAGLRTLAVATIEETAALVARADLVISPDTSVVHIAALLRVPLVALYPSRDNLVEWRPDTELLEILVPETIGGGSVAHRADVMEIASETVAAAARRVTAASAGRRPEGGGLAEDQAT
jgi:ADP-heptose:LPS heptosyltransferase